MTASTLPSISCFRRSFTHFFMADDFFRNFRRLFWKARLVLEEFQENDESKPVMTHHTFEMRKFFRVKGEVINQLFVCPSLFHVFLLWGNKKSADKGEFRHLSIPGSIDLLHFWTQMHPKKAKCQVQKRKRHFLAYMMRL